VPQGQVVTILDRELLDHPKGSMASILVEDDGTVAGGTVQAVGSGLLIIVPIPESPYHVVFARTGTLPFH
jgi:hypothetical protein